MPCSAASDLGLHCLPMSLLWDTRHKWVNVVKYICRDKGYGGGGGGVGRGGGGERNSAKGGK